MSLDNQGLTVSINFHCIIHCLNISWCCYQEQTTLINCDRFQLFTQYTKDLYLITIKGLLKKNYILLATFFSLLLFPVFDMYASLWQLLDDFFLKFLFSNIHNIIDFPSSNCQAFLFLSSFSFTFYWTFRLYFPCMLWQNSNLTLPLTIML